MSENTEIEPTSPVWMAPFGPGPVSYGITINGGVPTLGVAPALREEADRPPTFVREPPRAELSQEKVREIPVEVDVVIGRTMVSVARLMSANEGECFRLDRRFGESVELQVNGKTIGYGEIVSDDHENFIGIRLIEVVPDR